jgi:transposase InsO family protein
MEGADLRFRPADGTEGTQIDSLVSRGRGRRCRPPKAYFVAARRLPVRPAADRPASDALVAASLPQAPRDLPAAAGRRRCVAQAQVQGLSAYPIGYFHIDFAEVRTAQGKLYLIVAIDRTSKFASVELHEKVARQTAGDFLRRLIAAVPLQGPHGPHRQRNPLHHARHTGSAAPDVKAALDAGEPVWAHAFEYACAQNDIDHRLTKPKHPWTNGQVERMNRTIKDATVKRYFYDTHDQLRDPLRDFVDAYNFARRLKTLKGLTPYEFVCKAWNSEPKRFTVNPPKQTLGLNI